MKKIPTAVLFFIDSVVLFFIDSRNWSYVDMHVYMRCVWHYKNIIIMNIK